MRQANDYLTACGWCWIGVDAPVIDGQISVAEKQTKKVRPYIQVYSPLEVVDWKFDGIGGIQWLITESKVVESTTPDKPEIEYTVRRIWTAGMVRIVKIYVNEKGKSVVESDETYPIFFVLTFSSVAILSSCFRFPVSRTRQTLIQLPD
jgi:hypothetical protein